MTSVGRTLRGLRNRLAPGRREAWEAERLLALESETMLLREENARLIAERARPTDSTALVERLRELGGEPVDPGRPSVGGSEAGAWEALTRAAALREGLIAVCVELEQAAAHARIRLEELGPSLDASEPPEPDPRRPS